MNNQYPLYPNFFHLYDVARFYGSREQIGQAIATGSIPDPYFERQAVLDDIKERKKRGECQQTKKLPCMTQKKKIPIIATIIGIYKSNLTKSALLAQGGLETEKAFYDTDYIEPFANCHYFS